MELFGKYFRMQLRFPSKQTTSLLQGKGSLRYSEELPLLHIRIVTNMCIALQSAGQLMVRARATYSTGVLQRVSTCV
jgi:hypothetical protein